MSQYGEKIERAIEVAKATGRGLLPEEERWGSYCFGPLDPEWAKEWFTPTERRELLRERWDVVKERGQKILDFAAREHREEKLKVILRGLSVRGYDDSPLDGVFGIIVDYSSDRGGEEAYKLWLQQEQRCVWVNFVEPRLANDGAYEGVRAHFPAKHRGSAAR